MVVGTGGVLQESHYTAEVCFRDRAPSSRTCCGDPYLLQESGDGSLDNAVHGPRVGGPLRQEQREATGPVVGLHVFRGE